MSTQPEHTPAPAPAPPQPSKVLAEPATVDRCQADYRDALHVREVMDQQTPHHR